MAMMLLVASFYCLGPSGQDPDTRLPSNEEQPSQDSPWVVSLLWLWCL